ncbi:MAG TPA: hypothetical protein VGJ12_09655, partial [Gemmatimonadaceae bacterium]
MLIIDVLHIRVEVLVGKSNDTIPSGRLGDVERIVGGLHELLPGVNTRVGKCRHAGADAARQHAPLVFELMRLYLLTRAFGERHPGVEHGARKKDHEFLSPVTADPVDVACGVLEELRELGEHEIADLVAVRIVHLLEVVDVEHDDGQRLVQAGRVLEHFIEPLVEM